MTPAERVERLLFVVPADAEVPTGVGGWRLRIVGSEIQLRNKRLPHLRLDLLPSEAADLRETLSDALLEVSLRPSVKVSWWQRVSDWLARRTWKRKHAFEQTEAMRLLVEEFKESKGGW
jgi:hypothetical protein